MTDARKVALDGVLASVTDHWRPRVVARLNGQEVKVVKFAGPFVWHRHDEADEMFLVWRGTFDMEFRDRTVRLERGDVLVVPRGVEHRPNAGAEVEVLLFEPEGVRNTGNVYDDRYTAPEAPSSGD